jgi:hypothetical protein
VQTHADSGDPHPHQPPLMFRPEDVRSVKWTIAYTGLNRRTVMRLVNEFGIGRRAGSCAPFQIHRIALEMALGNDREAIELLRAGKRDHPEVQRYVDHCKLCAFDTGQLT